MCILCTGFATTTPPTRLKNIGNDIFDVEFLIDMGSLVFTSPWEESVPFRAQNAVLNKPQVQRSVEEKKNVIDMLQQSPRSSTRRISARLIVLLMIVENFTYGAWLHPNHIQRIQHLVRPVMGKRPHCCGWIEANPHTIRNLLLTDEAPMESTVPKFPQKIPKQTHRITFP